MAKITLEEFYFGDTYNVYENALAEFLRKDKSTSKNINSEERIKLALLITKHTANQTINLIKNNDFISELETEIKSFYLYIKGQNNE